MTTRNAHTGKSKAETEHYNKAIKRIRTESTIDSVPTDTDTDNISLTNTLVTTAPARPSPMIPHIVQHIKNHWLSYLISIIGLLLTVLTLNLNREVGVVSERVNSVERNSLDIKTSVQSIETKFDNKYDRQDASVQALNRRVESLEIRAEYDKKYGKK